MPRGELQVKLFLSLLSKAHDLQMFREYRHHGFFVKTQAQKSEAFQTLHFELPKQK